MGEVVGDAVGDTEPAGEPVAVGLAVAGPHAAAAIATTRARPVPRTGIVLDRARAHPALNVEDLVNIALLPRYQPDGRGYHVGWSLPHGARPPEPHCELHQAEDEVGRAGERLICRDIGDLRSGRLARGVRESESDTAEHEEGQEPNPDHSYEDGDAMP